MNFSAPTYLIEEKGFLSFLFWLFTGISVKENIYSDDFLFRTKMVNSITVYRVLWFLEFKSGRLNGRPWID